jgi:hypothetical protein
MNLWEKEIEDMTPEENIRHLYSDLIPAYMQVLKDEEKDSFIKAYTDNQP